MSEATTDTVVEVNYDDLIPNNVNAVIKMIMNRDASFQCFNRRIFFTRPFSLLKQIPVPGTS